MAFSENVVGGGATDSVAPISAMHVEFAHRPIGGRLQFKVAIDEREARQNVADSKKIRKSTLVAPIRFEEWLLRIATVSKDFTFGAPGDVRLEVVGI